ncbi:MAG TPA: hypothetical protein VGQ00_04515 [Candidatus Norongarragalinales archaeon]|jgi:hypothetical protein|nr:hypothetical protein [Candidatus Norongarragalinales archaeon]
MKTQHHAKMLAREISAKGARLERSTLSIPTWTRGTTLQSLFLKVPSENASRVQNAINDHFEKHGIHDVRVDFRKKNSHGELKVSAFTNDEATRKAFDVLKENLKAATPEKPPRPLTIAKKRAAKTVREERFARKIDTRHPSFLFGKQLLTLMGYHRVTKWKDPVKTKGRPGIGNTHAELEILIPVQNASKAISMLRAHFTTQRLGKEELEQHHFIADRGRNVQYAFIAKSNQARKHLQHLGAAIGPK